MNNITNWYKNAVIYEIFIRSFFDSDNDGIGDIQGIIKKLDYLEALGIDSIWITPIYLSPNKDSGYDVKNYYEINQEYGTFADFDELVNESHKRNIKIIMELVANHTSSEHHWFKCARSNKNSKYRNYYIWRSNVNGQYPNNWMSSRTGHSVWTYVKETDSYYLHLYTPHQPDLNWKNEELRNEIVEIIKFWLDKGVDAFRLDVINKISKQEGLPNLDESTINSYAEMYFENQPLAHEYIHEIRSKIQKEYPNCVFIGQTSGINLDQAYKYTLDKKKQLDLFLQFEHTDMDKGALGTLKVFDLNRFIDIIFKWQNGCDGKLWNTIFLGSHDLPRMVSHYGDDIGYWKESAKMLATIQLFLRGTQIIYMGDEIGMSNVNYKSISDYRDIRTRDYYFKRVNENKENEEEVFNDIKKISRDNARALIKWECKSSHTDEPVTEENDHCDEMNVAYQISDANSILNYYKELIKIRKSEKILLNGKSVRVDIGKGVFAYKRVNADMEVTVIANFTADNKSLDYSYSGEKIIGNYNEKTKDNNLRPYEVIVLKRSRLNNKNTI